MDYKELCIAAAEAYMRSVATIKDERQVRRTVRFCGIGGIFFTRLGASPLAEWEHEHSRGDPDKTRPQDKLKNIIANDRDFYLPTCKRNNSFGSISFKAELIQLPTMRQRFRIFSKTPFCNLKEFAVLSRVSTRWKHFVWHTTKIVHRPTHWKANITEQGLQMSVVCCSTRWQTRQKVHSAEFFRRGAFGCCVKLIVVLEKFVRMLNKARE